MLASLLPGVREFRTPLVTGLLWAACLWLIAGNRIASSSATTDFIEHLADLGLPRTAWLAAGTLFTYLVGSLLVVRTSPVRWLEARLRRRAERYIRWLDTFDFNRAVPIRTLRRLWTSRHSMRMANNIRAWAIRENRGSAIDSWLHNRFSSDVADGVVPVMRSFGGPCMAPEGFEAYYTTQSMERENGHLEDVREEMARQFVNQVKGEQSAVEARIQLRNPELYAEVDRLRVEGELRLSMFWPLVILVGLLVGLWSPLLAFALVLPPLLAVDGQRRMKEADEKVGAVVVSGEVQSPTLDLMNEQRDGEPRDLAKRWTADPNQPPRSITSS